MIGIVQLISAALQLLYLIFKNKFERDADQRARKEALHAQAATAIKTGNLTLINNLFDQLRH